MPAIPEPPGDGNDVLVFFRAEHGAPERPEHLHVPIAVPLVEQPIAKAPARLALENQRDPVHIGFEIDHRVGAASRQIRAFDDHELPGLERHRRRQVHFEMRHVLGQPANPADDAAARQRTGFRRDHELGRHPQHAIGARPRLTHQNIALLGLEPRPAGRFLPADIDVPAH